MTVSSRYLQMQLREWKMLYFDQSFIEFCSYMSNYQ